MILYNQRLSIACWTTTWVIQARLDEGHNPNVLFELGMRMAFGSPTVLTEAKGTHTILDVDNMLRVFEYDPALWTSTVESDVHNFLPCLFVLHGQTLARGPSNTEEVTRHQNH